MIKNTFVIMVFQQETTISITKYQNSSNIKHIKMSSYDVHTHEHDDDHQGYEIYNVWKTSLFLDCEHHQRDNWCVAHLLKKKCNIDS